MVAEMQNIVYNEFLQAVLPSEDYKKYQLDTLTPSLYNESVLSVISVEFSTAAFRFGHTLVASLIQLHQENSRIDHEELDNVFFNVTLIQQDRSLNRLLRSMIKQKAKKIDPIITDALRNKLFR